MFFSGLALSGATWGKMSEGRLRILAEGAVRHYLQGLGTDHEKGCRKEY